jgi:hypothetical protein
MKTSKEYYMNLGLVWLLGPLIIGFSLHIHPFFGVVVWWGIAILLICWSLTTSSETGETQNNDKNDSLN